MLETIKNNTIIICNNNYKIQILKDIKKSTRIIRFKQISKETA